MENFVIHLKLWKKEKIYKYFVSQNVRKSTHNSGWSNVCFELYLFKVGTIVDILSIYQIKPGFLSLSQMDPYPANMYIRVFQTILCLFTYTVNRRRKNKKLSTTEFIFSVLVIISKDKEQPLTKFVKKSYIESMQNKLR